MRSTVLRLPLQCVEWSTLQAPPFPRLVRLAWLCSGLLGLYDSDEENSSTAMTPLVEFINIYVCNLLLWQNNLHKPNLT
jgi:hypothetical protein